MREADADAAVSPHHQARAVEAGRRRAAPDVAGAALAQRCADDAVSADRDVLVAVLAAEPCRASLAQPADAGRAHDRARAGMHPQAGCPRGAQGAVVGDQRRVASLAQLRRGHHGRTAFRSDVGG